MKLTLSIRTFTLTFFISTMLIVSGCGGSSDNEPVSPSVFTGVFLDSAVENLSYGTGSLSGITNSDGEFLYYEGELVTFYIGNLVLGTIQAQPVITPLTLAGTTDTTNQTAINIARLLQSLDSNSDPTDGIHILDNAASFAPDSIDFTVDSTTFENSPVVTSFIENSGGTLITESDAIAHLTSTIASLTTQATWNITNWNEADWQ